MRILFETASTLLARSIPIKCPTQTPPQYQYLSSSQLRFFQTTRCRRLVEHAEVPTLVDVAGVENRGPAGERKGKARRHRKTDNNTTNVSSPRIKPAPWLSYRKQKDGHTDSQPSATSGDEATAFQHPRNLSSEPSHGKQREHWQIDKQSIRTKFGEQGWNPRKKVSPDTMEGIRALHHQFPEKYTTPVLADQFKISPEAVRRILKSKWRPPDGKLEERRERWARRHDRIWDAQSEMGLRPKRTTDRKPRIEPQDESLPSIPISQ